MPAAKSMENQTRNPYSAPSSSGPSRMSPKRPTATQIAKTTKPVTMRL